jgi:hypothetical protein
MRQKRINYDEKGLVGVKEDILALSVVLVGFSIFVTIIFTNLIRYEEADDATEFHDIGPRVADELALDFNLRAPLAEPGVLSLQSIELMQTEQSNIGSEENIDFIRMHNLDDISYMIIIETIKIDNSSNGNDIVYTAGLTEQYSFNWGTSDSNNLNEVLNNAENVRSIRRPVSIMDENMSERISPGYVQVIVWR